MWALTSFSTCPACLATDWQLSQLCLSPSEFSVWLFHLTLSCLAICQTVFIINQWEEYIFTAYRKIIAQHCTLPFSNCIVFSYHAWPSPLMLLFFFSPVFGLLMSEFLIVVYNTLWNTSIYKNSSILPFSAAWVNVEGYGKMSEIQREI